MEHKLIIILLKKNIFGMTNTLYIVQNTLSIIIPVYNEADNLFRLNKVLLEYLKIAQIPTFVIFVNDGSTDHSLNIIKNICSQNAHFSYINLNHNQGLSAALKAGFDIATTSLIGYMDADLQTHPNDFNLLLEHMEDCDLISGNRKNREDNFLKKVASKTANTIRQWFTKDGMEDTGCPLKIIKTDVAKRLPMFKGMHRFLPALVQLEGGKTKQIPIKHYPRIYGKSKYNIGNRLFTSFIDCFIFLWMKKRYIKPFKTKI